MASRSRRLAVALANLTADRAGHAVQPLFKDCEACVQPVAIQIQGFDRRGQPAGLDLAVHYDRFHLLRLSREVGGCKEVTPQSSRPLIGKDGQSNRAQRGDTP